MLNIDLQLTNSTMALIPCEYFDHRRSRSYGEPHKIELFAKPVKKLEKGDNFTHNVSLIFSLTDCLTCENVSNRFLLHP